MAMGKVNRFAERPPRTLDDEASSAQAQMPDIIQRLVKLQEAQGVLQGIAEGNAYRGKAAIAGTNHGDHSNNIWADHDNHSNYTEKP